MAKARLLWVGYSGRSSHAHADVLKRLRQRDLVDFCAAVGTETDPVDREILNDPVLSHFDALFADYKAVFSDISSVIDRDSYSEFSAFEGETLRMMDRLHDRGPKYPFNDDFDTRRIMFLKHCSFWSQYLDKRKISFVLFFAVPHEVFTFVLFKIAKGREIPTMILHPEKVGIPRKSSGIHYGLFPQRTMHQNLFYVSESIEDIGVWTLSRTIRDECDRLGVNVLQGDPLSKVISLFESPTFLPLPSVHQSSFSRFKKEVKKKVARGRNEIYLFVRRAILSDAQKREHLRISPKSGVLQNSVIYFLPYQPEESSSPRGGIFVEQLFAVKCVAESLPDGWTLRVREHPDQYGRRRPRPRGFLREISEIPRVSIVPIDETIDQSFFDVRAAVGIAGTACVEAWLRRIPLLLFGDMFLKKAPGVFYIKSIDDIRKAFGSIQIGYQPSQIEIDEFVLWTAENSYVGSLYEVDGGVPDLHENTVDNLDTIISTWFSLNQ